jgi:hypothetical protein
LEPVVVVQTAEDRAADHRTTIAQREPSRAVRWLHAQTAVRAVMVVAYVPPKDSLGVAVVPYAVHEQRDADGTRMWQVGRVEVKDATISR